MKIFGYRITVGKEAPERDRSRGSLQTGAGGLPIRRRTLDPNLEAWLKGEEVSGQQAMTNAYAQVVWVYRAINAIAEAVANIPFRFSGLDENKRITGGRLTEFYERPHPLLNQFQYWELRVIWLMLRGECFRVPVFREERGRRVLDRIMILDPARFVHLIQDNQLIGWRYTSTGMQDVLQSQVFLPEEVWFERLPNPFDPWRGISPLSVASVAAASDYASGQYMKALMQNNGDAGLIVRTEDALTPEQQEEVKAALKERRRVMGTASRPLMLWGDAEVISPKAAAADIDLINHRKFTLGEICAAFGVNEEILTSVNAAKYDVMKGARLNFIENRVAPLCRRLEAEEQKSIRLIEPRARGFFAIDEHPIMAEARRERLRSAQAGFAMGIPLNELNRAMELGFKAFPWGDTGYIPANMRVADGTDPGPSAGAQGGANGSPK